MSTDATATLGSHLRGHVLRFNRSWSLPYDAASGTRLLLVVAAVEATRTAVVNVAASVPPLWLYLPLQLAVVLVLFRLVARASPSDIGFRAWREWNVTERSYFVQVLCLLNVVFLVVMAVPLQRIVREGPAAEVIGTVFIPFFLHGFYQEVAYRGVVQNELVRRGGAGVGVVLGSVIYTFGPLHFNYFTSPTSSAVPMFASILASGLFLGTLYHRTGNLWMVAAFHGVVNAYMAVGFGSL